eukprot:CAMPEP_0118808510 /NCGR_PEP_ID=MMETSP1161-20130426/36018_1 /TAXON_ID=249345 /ORGANISM="Picochlorum oklahomensis, Strain CCMP2329" /LENGTH=384 /DNA_ID=CAMNT_0006737901 /DNA_START=523 /DNA_END=1678 /DNA_ORIENTATION=-
MPSNRNEFFLGDAKGDFRLTFAQNKSSRKGNSKNRESLPTVPPKEIHRAVNNEEINVRHFLDSFGASQQQHMSHGSPTLRTRFVSGPRMAGEGCTSDSQEITSAICLDDRTVLLRITILAAGFVIGPKGSSIKSISEKFDVHIQSKTVLGGEYREFKCSGERANLMKCIQTIKEAVCTYKRLTEGEFKGACIQSSLIICGIAFDYCPPPKSKMPHAASGYFVPRLGFNESREILPGSENVTSSVDSNSSCGSRKCFTPRKVPHPLKETWSPITPGLLERKCELSDALSLPRKVTSFSHSEESDLLHMAQCSAKRNQRIKQIDMVKDLFVQDMNRERTYARPDFLREEDFSRTETSDSLDTQSSSGSNSLKHVRNLMNDFQNVFL